MFFIIYVLFLTLSIPAIPLRAQLDESAVTQGPKVGRLGNSLLNYCKAKWVSKKKSVALHMLPFVYSDKLMLHHKEQKINQSDFTTKNLITFHHTVDIKDRKIAPNTLYQILFNFRDPSWLGYNKMIEEFKSDKEFIEELREMIKPINPQLLDLPQNKATVAVHVRKGGGYAADKHWIYKKYPTRFPPDVYYVEQLMKLSVILNFQPMYVHIFTDDPNPQQVVETFKSYMNAPHIEFCCRQEGNAHDQNVIDDLYNMAQFDYFIRPSSTFSIVAEIIGRHKIVLFPEEAYLDLEKKIFLITKSGLHFYEH